jgi:hypothetical protein
MAPNTIMRAGAAQEQTACLLAGDPVELGVTQGALGAVRPDHELRVGQGDRGDRPARRDGGQQIVEGGQGHVRLDHHLDRPATGETHLESVAVAHPVRMSLRLLKREDLLCGRIDRTLDAAAGNAADDLAVLVDGHRRAGLPGRRTPGVHHRGHREGDPGGAPGQKAVHDLAHASTFRDRRRIVNDELRLRLGRC